MISMFVAGLVVGHIITVLWVWKRLDGKTHA